MTSTAIHSVGYDANSHILEIEFDSHEVYQYLNVPQAVANGLMSAPSKGQYFNSYIKTGGYQFRHLKREQQTRVDNQPAVTTQPKPNSQPAAARQSTGVTQPAPTAQRVGPTRRIQSPKSGIRSPGSGIRNFGSLNERARKMNEEKAAHDAAQTRTRQNHR